MKKYQTPKADMSSAFSANDIISTSEGFTYKAYGLNEDGGVGDTKPYIG